LAVQAAVRAATSTAEVAVAVALAMEKAVAEEVERAGKGKSTWGAGSINMPRSPAFLGIPTWKERARK